MLNEIYKYTLSGKNYGISSSRKNVPLVFFYYLAVNKLITDKTQNIFLIAEHSGFIKSPFSLPMAELTPKSARREG